MTNKKSKFTIICFIGSLLLIALDQIIKVWVFRNFNLGETKRFLPGFIELEFVKNSGGAFGILSNHTALLSVISAAFIIFLIVALLTNKIEEPILMVSISLIVAGGVGNLIDRIARGYVIDYLKFDMSFLKNFPVFNLADCCVVIGAILMIIFTLVFEFRNEDKEVLF